MFFSLKNEDQLKKEFLAGYKAKQTAETLQFFQHELEKANGATTYDIDLVILPALGLAYELGLITYDAYRRIQSEAETIGRENDKLKKKK